MAGIYLHVFNGTCDYDIIFGRYFLRLIDMAQDFAQGIMTAFSVSVKMKPNSF